MKTKKVNGKKNHYFNLVVSDELYWRIKAAAILERKPPVDWIISLAADYLKFRVTKKGF